MDDEGDEAVMDEPNEAPTAFMFHGLSFYGKVHSEGCISWAEELLESGEIKRTALMPRHAATADFR